MAVIAVGADHAGFALKQAVRARLIERGHQVIDFGTHSTDSVDYPDFAALVACAVREGVAERGVLVCGSGIGMAIAANKVAGIRAAVAADAETARLSRQHNDANVLALGAHREVGAHHRRRLRHADVHEVLDPRGGRGAGRLAHRDQVHLAELPRLGRAGARRADELHEGVRGLDGRDEGHAVERIADALRCGARVGDQALQGAGGGSGHGEIPV